MLTGSKKNYAGSIAMQEGNILKKPKQDIKGLAIKKVSTNKTARENFTNILFDDILTSDKIDPSNILKKYAKFEDEIRESFEQGEIKFATPGNVKSIDNYVNPYTVQTLRGSIIWNELYPNKSIVFPDKINFVKLKELSLEEIETILTEETNLSDEERNQYIDIIDKTIFSDENLAKYKFKVICMPKSQQKIPEWLIPLLDIDKMIEDTMKPGYKILESLGFKVLSYQVGDNTGEVVSNIVSI